MSAVIRRTIETPVISNFTSNAFWDVPTRFLRPDIRNKSFNQPTAFHDRENRCNLDPESAMPQFLRFVVGRTPAGLRTAGSSNVFGDNGFRPLCRAD
jgi:hypothetical protein